MAECFIYGQSDGGSSESSGEPLILFEGREDGYSFADGLTGFKEYYPDDKTAVGGVRLDNIVNAQQTDELYGLRIEKSYSGGSGESNYKDSAVFLSNEKIDLSAYKFICFEFYGHCDYSTTADNIENYIGAYFMINAPENMPQSNVVYDWDGWNKIPYVYHRKGMYYFDISQIDGEHFITFGIYHGNYSIGYTNGIKIYKMFLI